MTRRRAADSAIARQGEVDKVTDDLELELHAKAKEEPGFRFYQLYDKIYRADILDYAYRSCRANKGAAGVDGMRFENIETCGVEQWLGELAQRLRKKDYRPEAVKRVWIPKPNGKQRPLGIPTITDRAVQTAAMLVLEPIFEADLQPEQYACRAGRGALNAVQAVRDLLVTGHGQVIDADLSGYFDSMSHADLMKSMARRIVDKHVLHLIKQWLEAPVEEHDEGGNRKRNTANRDARHGTSQGAPISPLLSNLYLRRFMLGWKQPGYASRHSARIVNYADDFVICCKYRADEAMEAMQTMMKKLKLTVNAEKTHLCRIPQAFDFLGYTFGRCHSRVTGKACIGSRPSKKRIKRMVQSITGETARNRLILEASVVVGRLNRQLNGWANYFSPGPVSPAYQAINTRVTPRLRQWLCKKHKVCCTGKHYPDQYLYEKSGLIDVRKRTHNLPWAKA